MMRNAAWLSVGSVLTAAAIGWGTYDVVDLVAHEMETRIESFDAAAISVLDVESGAGSVLIQSADVDQITVRARIGHGLHRSKSSVRVDGDRLVVRASCPLMGSQWCNVRYTIEVPMDIDVVVDGDNDGVRVTGINGRVEAHSDNGSIRATDITGDVVLSTNNGSIHGDGLVSDAVQADADNGSVTIQMATTPRSLIATSNNGNVMVVLPTGDQVYAVDIHADNGNIGNTLLSDPASDHRIVVSSDNGDVTARYAGQ